MVLLTVSWSYRNPAIRYLNNCAKVTFLPCPLFRRTKNRRTPTSIFIFWDLWCQKTNLWEKDLVTYYTVWTCQRCKPAAQTTLWARRSWTTAQRTKKNINIDFITTHYNSLRGRSSDMVRFIQAIRGVNCKPATNTCFEWGEVEQLHWRSLSDQNPSSGHSRIWGLSLHRM